MHVAAEPGRWKRVVVRCAGSTRPIREVLDGGEVLMDGIPEGGACEARLAGGDRPLTVEFTGGNARTDIDDP